MVAVEIVTLAAVALLGVLVVGLLRSNAELHRALHGLGVDLGPDGAPAPGAAARSTPVQLRPTPARPDATHVPDIVGTTPDGDAVGVPVGAAAGDTLLAFLTSGCSTCQAFWPVLRDTPQVPGGARLVVVTRGDDAESPPAVAALAGPVQVVMSSAAWLDYDVPYAPYFVYVSGGRVVGEGAAATWEAMATLIGGALADRGAPATTPRIPKAAADAEREARIDRELAAAGIFPGDPRLHARPVQGPPTP